MYQALDARNGDELWDYLKIKLDYKPHPNDCLGLDTLAMKE